MYNYTNTDMISIILGTFVFALAIFWLVTTTAQVGTSISNEADLLTKKLSEKRKWYLHLPVVCKTQNEVDELPLSTDQLQKTCELGTWVKYPKDQDFPDYIILGHVVDSCNALACQAGGCAMSLPTTPGSGVRFTNHYRVRVSI